MADPGDSEFSANDVNSFLEEFAAALDDQPPGVAWEVFMSDCTVEEARARVAERDRINGLASAIEGTSVANWPPFALAWDTGPENFYRSFDGADPDYDVSDLTCFWYALAKLDAHLASYNARTAEEVWGVGSDLKSAKAIVFWSEGGRMSPPILAAREDGKIGLNGGNHRLAVARAKGATTVPVLVHERDRAEIFKILGEPVRSPIQGSD